MIVVMKKVRPWLRGWIPERKNHNWRFSLCSCFLRPLRFTFQVALSVRLFGAAVKDMIQNFKLIGLIADRRFTVR